MPLYMKLPIRGFNNARFRKEMDVVNLEQIEAVFNDGDTVNIDSLKAHGFINGKTHGVKILGNGELKKKLNFQVQAISAGARDKLTDAKIPFEINK